MVRAENKPITRSQNKKLLKTRRPKTERFKKSLAYYGPKKWNALPSDLHQTEDKWEFRKLARNRVTLRSIGAIAIGGHLKLET